MISKSTNAAFVRTKIIPIFTPTSGPIFLTISLVYLTIITAYKRKFALVSSFQKKVQNETYLSSLCDYLMFYNLIIYTPILLTSPYNGLSAD